MREEEEEKAAVPTADGAEYDGRDREGEELDKEAMMQRMPWDG